MFKRIQRIGSTPCKFQYALVLKDLTLSLPLDGMDIQCIWTRGPHRCKSISATSKGDGQYAWNFEEQKRQPMMLNCTLYRKDAKEKEKDGKTTNYQSKPCKITIKHVIDNGNKTRTIGEVTLDLAEHALDKVYNHDFELEVEGTKNIEATLSFTLHSRPLTTGKEAQLDTVSTIEGMDQSVVDDDSVADFGNAKLAKKKGLDSESDDDLEDPDEVMGGFGTAGVKTRKEQKNRNPFDSDASSDDDDADDLGGFGTAKSNETKKISEKIAAKEEERKKPTSAVAAITAGSARGKFADDDDHSPEVSRNSRPSVLRDKNTIFKSKEKDMADRDRMKQLEGLAIKAEHAKDEFEERLLRLQNELKKEKEKNHNLEQELNLHDRNTKEIVDGIVLEWSTKVAELQVETKSLSTRINEIELQNDQRLRDSLAQQEEEHQRMITISQQEITQLKREVEQLRGRKLSYDEVIENIRVNYAKHKLPDELKALTLQVKYYERQLVEADLTIDCVRNTYQSTNTVLMTEVRNLEDVKQQLKAALSEAGHANNQLHQHNMVLETQCKKHSESRIKMSEILNSMEVMLSEKEEKLTTLQTENNDLRLELLKVRKQLHRFQQNGQ